MFPTEKESPMSRIGMNPERLYRMQARGRQGAFQAKERMGPFSKQARERAEISLHNARMWGAPRLEKTGKYIESELGPRIGHFLSRTAKKIEPAESKGRNRTTALMMLAASGVIGAAGVMASRRNVINPYGTRSHDEVDRDRLGSEPSTDGQSRMP